MLYFSPRRKDRVRVTAGTVRASVADVMLRSAVFTIYVSY